MQSQPAQNRVGKRRNILVLADDFEQAAKIIAILKSVVDDKRCSFQTIEWDEFEVGEWQDEAALLVLSGKVPELCHSPILQFIGNGGRVFGWCCGSAAFGLVGQKFEDENEGGFKKVVLKYGSIQTNPVDVSDAVWRVNTGIEELVPRFERLLDAHNSDLVEHFGSALTTSVFATIRDSNEAAILQLTAGGLGGKAVLSRVHFEHNKNEASSLALLSVLLDQVLGIECSQSKSPEKYTYGYLLGDDETVKDFLASTSTIIKQSNLTIEFINPETLESERTVPSFKIFPVLSFEKAPPSFPSEDYFSNLTTTGSLGRLVIYTDVISSTMNVFKGNSIQHGITFIADRLTAGRGKEKIIWLSPQGCACFAIQLNLPVNSQIGLNPALIPLIAAMSVVLAVPNHKELGLQVKQPNDVYLGNQKIGGVLVESMYQEDTIIFMIAIGVNVSTEKPAPCLNNILEDEAKLSSASLIAKCLSQMEILLERVESEELYQNTASYTDN